MAHADSYRKSPFSILIVLLVWLCSIAPASATELPAGVMTYLREKDPQVQVRFDGLVIFSNGESYLPVLPQDPSLKQDALHVVKASPEAVAYPDLIQFDNNLFLLRLIQTSSGRLTVAKLTEYPIQMKEGLLPQDLVLPPNLYLPAELKVILGALPYNPTYEPPTGKAPPPPAALTLSQVPAPAASSTKAAPTNVLYLFDMSNHKVIGLDSVSGRNKMETALDCVPSDLQVGPEGKLVFISCLTNNELIVLDTSSGLIKTRIPVGSRPEAIAYLPKLDQVLVSHRFSNFITAINGTDLLPGKQLILEGSSGVMAVDPARNLAYVADAFKPSVSVVDIATQSIVKTIDALPNVSALSLSETADGGQELWVASRTKHQVRVMDANSGKEIALVDVGKKPMALLPFNNSMYVVSAGDSRLDVIDRTSKALLSPISLKDDSFPSDMVVMPGDERAFVTAAGIQELFVVDLKNGRLDNSWPLTFRVSAISTLNASTVAPAAKPTAQAASAKPGATEEATKTPADSPELAPADSGNVLK